MTVAKTISSATPQAERLIYAALTSDERIAVSGFVAGVRGEVNVVQDSTLAASRYCYAMQGKIVVVGEMNVPSGSAACSASLNLDCNADGWNFSSRWGDAEILSPAKEPCYGFAC